MRWDTIPSKPGAEPTFDSCLRFLNEDPWERLRKIRAKVKNTKLQMLFLRSEHSSGYRHYADDVVAVFRAEVHRQRHRHHSDLRRTE